MSLSQINLAYQPLRAQELIVDFSYTMQSQQNAKRGFTPGFDYLRLGLALSVLCWHTVAITGGATLATETMQSWWSMPIRFVLPMFFALSGFLVASSLTRSNTLIEFLYLRVLRILPALALEVVLSALFLGAIATTLPLKQYFVDPTFFKYFYNIVGYIHYLLPGVFETNRYEGVVNGSLWTVPYELECYIALAMLAVFGITRRRVLFMIALGLFIFVDYYIYVGSKPAMAIQSVLGKTLVLYFLAGVAVNLWRDVIPYNKILFFICVALTVALIKDNSSMYLTPIPVAYLTAYLGLSRPAKIPVIMDGDYSYGVYLYAFPIQQTVAHFFTTNWMIHLPLSIIGVGAFAALSWHGVEKPLQKYKKLASKIRIARPVPWRTRKALEPANSTASITSE